MDGLWWHLRIDKENIDSLIAQGQLKLCRETSRGSGSVGQRMIDFDH